MYIFIAFAPRSTFSWSRSACYGLNWSVWKWFLSDRNTWNHIIVNKLFVLDKNTWYINLYKLFVLDKNTWYHKTEYKLFVLDRNNWYHIAVCKLFVLDKNTWYINLYRLFVLDRNTWYHSALSAGAVEYTDCFSAEG